ncbi:trehalose-phosphatase [Gordonia sp. (in: high G+C Gram-positive bacteria)]|uniref:trehalose-phosphatase n=2 Tax=Gordonia sp. (in: high G+C Gram-positive bacteria) TaxID=84139 RepID=UPI002612160F|nr:trehalose-phosphatase [Gordonia sp. (in: high G+C Gram-positive bacteria)]HMS74466.1 trehalose-phosphatase [Gordonia sp. (in: high G+C Gram-positive bacteria)]
MSNNSISDALRSALTTAAATRHLLVASDYDGVLSPIVSQPEDAVPNPASVAAIESAAALPNTSAAVVSGRALADLSLLSGLPVGGPVTLIGSHGTESSTGFVTEVTDGDRARLARIIAEFDTLAADYPGVRVEPKPISVALHVRNAAPADADAALRRARDGAAGWDGVEATEGKAVIELAVIKTSKGHALDALRVRSGADAVIYLGDDVTDEKAFAHLGAGDVSIKVGDGPTIARHRIPDTDTVATVLQFLLTQRSHIVIADNRRDQTS